jgi:hypothetical protein
MAFMKKARIILAKGFVATKGLAAKAGKNANDLAAKGALKFEGAQMKSHVDKLLAKLGKEVYYKLVDMDKSTVSRENPLISAILEEIKGINAEIDRKRSEYRAIGAETAAKA